MNKSARVATITTLRRRTKALLKLAQEHPIAISRYGKPAFVLMSVQHYELLFDELRDAT
ncbi:type II toxin-antitoxin system prevent-host-death family antitoxin [uncultured Tateyamaria sp.]|uniref:type II toxin-antitoxin system prevent-host-death family antitoxin n=1 Tax=uncultured Tateyamaria sp. TaxID=455651 RepID=UPI002601FE1C|nr:type II toxin-antitoxin system prevent-host-death family antitoxin [uncultured Tateyamaria sp.]